MTERDDFSDEVADIRRLSNAGRRTGDQETIDAAVTRAGRLHLKGEIDLNDPTTRRILGLDSSEK